MKLFPPLRVKDELKRRPASTAGVVAGILGRNQSYEPPAINQDESAMECNLILIPNQGIEITTEFARLHCVGYGSKNAAPVIARGERAPSL